ncbi:MAG: UDP-3-O-(3-hydroxymyristoyl)glucosamine N-acyltransferase [Candidatus Omnitrophica bacterium]|nr:UDP-3-O-(3-hydroxymyristoyl)glucosamine N-acyltransferase [Candidatus Omnitrophota bacterium]
MRKRLKEIAETVGGKIIGDGNTIITGISGIIEAKKGDIAFVANRKYLHLMEKTKASAILVFPNITNSSRPLIQVENPSLAFSKIISSIGPEPIQFPPSIHPTAVIGENVKLGKNVSIQPYVVIEDNSKIGDHTTLCSGVYIGHYTQIGNNCRIYPYVSIRERIIIGNRVIVHSGTIIGSDGFGFAALRGVHHKIPQIGTVVIEDDVEIGANVTIDRARFDKTWIKKGVKIDNLVQIAHNVVIGENSIIVAQVGISGSTTIGKNVIIAGQAGLIGHITVGDNAVIAGKSGVTKDIPANLHVSGFPAREKGRDMKAYAYISRFPKLLKKIAILEERIKKLEEKTKK